MSLHNYLPFVGIGEHCMFAIAYNLFDQIFTQALYGFDTVLLSPSCLEYALLSVI